MSNLKLIREQVGITQEDLARLINVSAKTIHNIEKRNNTDVQTAIQLSRILNTPVEVLFKK